MVTEKHTLMFTIKVGASAQKFYESLGEGFEKMYTLQEWRLESITRTELRDEEYQVITFVKV